MHHFLFLSCAWVCLILMLCVCATSLPCGIAWKSYLWSIDGHQSLKGGHWSLLSYASSINKSWFDVLSFLDLIVHVNSYSKHKSILYWLPRQWYWNHHTRVTKQIGIQFTQKWLIPINTTTRMSLVWSSEDSQTIKNVTDCFWKRLSLMCNTILIWEFE